MANTINAALLIDTLSQKAITFLAPRLAPLKAFSRDFSTDELVQTKNVQVPKITAGSTTLTNPTNYEAGDSTLANVAVPVNAYSQPFQISSAEYNQRMRLEMLAQGNLRTLANKISDVWTALILTANLTPTSVVVAQASFAASNAKTIWGNIGTTSQKFLLLDAVAYAQLAPSDKNAFQLGESGALGYDGIFLQTRWTGATANTYGLGCGPELLAVAAGIPAQVPGLAQEMIEQKVVMIEDLGLAVQVNLWISRASRSLWASYDLIFGAAIADGAAGNAIRSA